MVSFKLGKENKGGDLAKAIIMKIGVRTHSNGYV